MPQYDYSCLDCNEHFSTIMTLGEHERGQVKCPKCGGSKVEQQPAVFSAVTTRKS